MQQAPAQSPPVQPVGTNQPDTTPSNNRRGCPKHRDMDFMSYIHVRIPMSNLLTYMYMLTSLCKRNGPVKTFILVSDPPSWT